MNGDELLARQRIRHLVEQCQNCALCKVGSGPVPFRGPAPSEIAILGEAPGENEDREHKPFVGPSGMAAQRWLRESGIDPDRVAWLNTVSCFPRRAPNPREVEACHDTLAIQLKAINPTWILVLGGIACSRWWRVRVGDLRGLWWRVPDTEALALATWHPAAVLRNPRLEWQARIDVAKFAEAATKDRIWFLREKYCVICHREEVWRWDKERHLGWCYKHDPLSNVGGGRKAKFVERKIHGTQGGFL